MLSKSHLISVSFLLKVAALCIFMACSRQAEPDVAPDPLFEWLSPEVTGIDFENRLEYLSNFNIYTYRNFYDGGGVAVGDLSGNGLPDIYFISNMGPNRLYFNQGDYRFVDVTDEAGVAGTRRWSTAAALVDINGNGLLDIYVTNSGKLDDATNELFINNGDGTFTERAAEFGLDDPGFGIQAYFFDYDGDGLPDMFLINNEDQAISSFDLSNLQRYERDFPGGDRLFRNEGGFFRDVTEEAGILSSIIGFALSAAVSDLNRNGLPDIFVANDFFERDYIYMNNGDGTFTEVGGDERVIRSMSAASMGSDIADLNNNGWPDIYVSDMLPFKDERIKTVTLFEDWDRYREKVEWGYGHQFTRNVLHLNQNGTHYKEVSRLTGTEATDWSWAVLLADFDHNGFNDILVTNGLVQDITNVDYLGEISDQETMRAVIRQEGVDFQQLIDMIPSQKVRNVMFANNGRLNFEDITVAWGLGEPTFSSGAAWADLNGNGALDLVISNVNQPSRIYRNRVNELHPERSWLRIDLEGEGHNTQAIGAQLQLWGGGQQWFREHFLQRGFQSSVEPGFFVGLGELNRIDSLVVRWPDGRTSRMQDIDVPARISLSQKQGESRGEPLPGPAIVDRDAHEVPPKKFEKLENTGLSFRHLRHPYSDFQRDRMLYQMRSTEGPAMCTGDVTGNGLDDVYAGGARNQAGQLFLQGGDGRFEASGTDFSAHASSEDIACLFFDATGNGLMDLYVVSGGNSHGSASAALLDRLYLNRGNGELVHSGQPLPLPARPVSGSVAVSADFTGNGHADLFVGTRLRPFAIGVPADSYLLEGDGTGQFRDVTADVMPGLTAIGMVTDAALGDVTGDGRPELVVVGEYMHPRVFARRGAAWTDISGELGLQAYTGIWYSVLLADVTGNGRLDIVGGNHGLNSLLRGTPERPQRMWVGDFEQDGIVNQILAINQPDGVFPLILRHDLLDEVPGLAAKYPDYASFGGQQVTDIFTRDQLDAAILLEAAELGSVLFRNEGEAGFRAERLPLRAQFGPVFGLAAADLTGDGRSEILLGGNLFEVRPQQGPYDALRGTVLRFDAERDQLLAYPADATGFDVFGQLRQLRVVRTSDGSLRVIAARYDDEVLIFGVE
ncbi:MAG: VCBS repeat-containing protein [Candidatus Cyclonatronum sp.]|uniref:VCBS repeat-containing protein n=1 Tax=Cyclonatronum sp. TaxID=3024185 RepID=UPI0025C494F9|nr:VCBS repeat-containing protein [Cyclonatronum sp.]MCH8486165.1 VCBS repeat-containing protein [Cyclonatronum sp.]